MIIDCHTHLNNYANEDEDALSHRLSELTQEMKRNRVDYALILTSYKDVAGRPSTDKVLLAVQGQKHLGVVAGVHFATLDAQQIEAFAAWLSEGMIKGIKLYPGYEPFYPSDPRLLPIYKLAERYQVPVMIHSGDTLSRQGKLKYAHPLVVDEVAVDFPKVNFIICHLGNPWLHDTMEVLYKNENVYADISGLVLGDFSDRFEAFMSAKFQEMLLYGIEPSKILYGTDWPIANMASYLDWVDQLVISPRDREKILYQNAARLFDVSWRNSLFS